MSPVDDGRGSATSQDLEDLALSDDYALNPAFVDMVVDAAERGDAGRLGELLEALHPADIADLMGFLTGDYREALVPLLKPDVLAEVLPELEGALREDILEHVAPVALAEAALGEMLDSDDATADLVDDLDAGVRGQVLACWMSDVDRAGIDALAWLRRRERRPADAAGGAGRAAVPGRSGPGDRTRAPVGRRSCRISSSTSMVVDPANRPLGARVREPPPQKPGRTQLLSEIMEPVTEIPTGMDQEEVAYIFDKYHLISAPVIEPGGRLVGQITVDDIVGMFIRRRVEEDMLALANVSDAGRDASIVGVVRSRLPWLVVNLVAETIAVSAIAIFQDEIAKIVALAQCSCRSSPRWATMPASRPWLWRCARWPHANSMPQTPCGSSGARSWPGSPTGFCCR